MEANCSRVLTEVGEMNNFVSEKRRLVKEDSYRDGIGILRQSKESVMNGGDYGEDEDSFIKLTKAMELEIDIYSVIVQEISAVVSKWAMLSTTTLS